MSWPTRFTRLVGCRLPVQLAVLGGVGDARLADAVIAAGGLGMVPAGARLPGRRPAGAGFILAWGPPTEAELERVAGVTVIEFFWGPPARATVRSAAAVASIVGWQVGSAEEARAAEAAGCAYVVAQGTEAGGHVRGVLPLDRCLEEVRRAVAVPVVAAGGVATAARVRRLIVEGGADAVRVGTRFLAADESNAHPDYKQLLIQAHEGDTVLTTHFDDGWEDAPPPGPGPLSAGCAREWLAEPAAARRR